MWLHWGVLFQQEDDQNTTLEDRMGDQSNNLTSLTAVAMILFFALYPPCLATMIMVRVQTGQYRWMVLALVFPTALGLGVASAAYSLGLAPGHIRHCNDERRLLHRPHPIAYRRAVPGSPTQTASNNSAGFA